MKTLLFVDDEPNDRLLVELGCERAGVSFQLKTVASGVEARPGQKDAEKIRRFVANAREAAAKAGTRE